MMTFWLAGAPDNYQTNVLGENLMKLISKFLSIAILTVVAIVSMLTDTTSVALAAPAMGSWQHSIQGEGNVSAQGFSIKVSTHVWSDSTGTAFGSFFYERNDGFKMYANAECARTFQQGKVATIAGPISKKIGTASQGDGENWMYFEISDQSTDKIRVLTLSKVTALKVCNQPTKVFPGTFTSGNITIR